MSRASVLIVTVALLISGTTFTLIGAPTKGDKEPAPPANSKPGPLVVELRFSDNSQVRLTAKTETIALATRYGTLNIPIADISHVEFATRLPEETNRRIEAAIKNLGSKEFKDRDQAKADLIKLGAFAYPALVAAGSSDDPEVKHAIEEIVTTIKENVPEEALVVRRHDVIHTADSKFTGTIETAVIKGTTVPFGEVQCKLADIRSLRSQFLAADDPDKNLPRLPDPGSLLNYQNQFGKRLAFTVTGNPGNGGAVWGTNVYTLDSSLSVAAVHAGVLKPGQTGVVVVQIVPSPPNFTGTFQNGIQSQNWPQFPGGAFQVIKRNTAAR